MVVPFLTGSRRGRFLSIVLLFTGLILWFGYQTPLSTVRPEPFDLHKGSPAVPNVARPPHDHATPQHDYPAQEAESSETEDIGSGSYGFESEPGSSGDRTTTTESTQTTDVAGTTTADFTGSYPAESTESTEIVVTETMATETTGSFLAESTESTETADIDDTTTTETTEPSRTPILTVF
ncbi:hypothetical protein C8A01DRAFT_33363 [Parachaetomium inaequale]|uniref:Uncharacterized protein n=1 Tax=Parachaetomium inaequale TaxID=2588326 RepID=A0AAN6SUG5_9PEZI|nr:hypothetical protein C8A01DRAFT_33363 [Parachaetomium inaequale]